MDSSGKGSFCLGEGTLSLACGQKIYLTDYFNLLVIGMIQLLSAVSRMGKLFTRYMKYLFNTYICFYFFVIISISIIIMIDGLESTTSNFKIAIYSKHSGSSCYTY